MPVKYRDYYQTLGVQKSASQDEIKSAFRKLARKFHPDTASDKIAAEEKFKEINEAYEVLGDPEKRRKYDELGPDWERMAGAGAGAPGADWRGTWGGDPRGGVEFEFGGTGFSDFFEQIFGTRRTSRRGGMWTDFGEEPAAARGQDIESDILVTLEEALRGSTRQISFRRSPGGKAETYTVKIPMGVRQGQRIRLAGIGGSGAAGGRAGDLYLRVKYEQHPEFEVSGSDLIHEAEVPAWQAVLGAEISVPAIEGRARLKIPPGSQQGQRFRIAGKGLPRPGGQRGNFYVVLKAVLPPAPVGGAESALWKQIADLHGGH
jgi:curved DNA-binding protein